jgi:hypothetical protein
MHNRQGFCSRLSRTLLHHFLCPCLQAKVTQQANMMAGKRSAPMWALAAIMFLGWNEFMAVLWNPVLLIAGLLAFVFGYQMYNELDVDAELQRGWVMGAMNIWSKLGDVLKSVSGGSLQQMQACPAADTRSCVSRRSCEEVVLLL